MRYKGLALSGKAAAGKSHIAGKVWRLLTDRGTTCSSLSYSSLIREELAALGNEQPTRAELIEHGNWQRSLNPYHWRDAMEMRVALVAGFGCFPIIDNVRTVREFDAAQAWGFLLVRVTASGHDRAARLNTRGEDPLYAWSDDVTECELDQHTFDLWVQNGEKTWPTLEARRIIRKLERDDAVA
jgi:hypothetical protein